MNLQRGKNTKIESKYQNAHQAQKAKISHVSTAILMTKAPFFGIFQAPAEKCACVDRWVSFLGPPFPLSLFWRLCGIACVRACTQTLSCLFFPILCLYRNLGPLGSCLQPFVSALLLAFYTDIASHRIASRLDCYQPEYSEVFLLVGFFWNLLFCCQFSGDFALLRACVRACVRA